MDEKTFYETLAVYFLDSFAEDPVFASEILQESGIENVDEFYSRAAVLARLDGEPDK